MFIAIVKWYDYELSNKLLNIGYDFDVIYLEATNVNDAIDELKKKTIGIFNEAELYFDYDGTSRLSFCYNFANGYRNIIELTLIECNNTTKIDIDSWYDEADEKIKEGEKSNGTYC
jgi:hypothetical protein